MTGTIPAKEGYVPFQGYKTWYRIVGEREEPGKGPVLVLHGGPGATHDYLEPLEAMAATGRRVIFYDQLGCGKSATPSNPSLWTVDLYVSEVDAVRQALGLDRVHILGQSWGGMLGMEYALTQPAGLMSLTVADSPASMRQWVAEANRLRTALPLEVQQTLCTHEEAGTTDDPAYEEAMMVVYRIRRPAREYRRFEAGLCFLWHLPAEEAVALLGERARALAEELVGYDDLCAALYKRGLGRLALVELEYAQALRRAELAWVQRLVDDVASGALEWRVKPHDALVCEQRGDRQ
jgi:pimeloyl-ACP methyl ester carboxylesterase